MDNPAETTQRWRRCLAGQLGTCVCSERFARDRQRAAHNRLLCRPANDVAGLDLLEANDQSRMNQTDEQSRHRRRRRNRASRRGRRRGLLVRRAARARVRPRRRRPPPAAGQGDGAPGRRDRRVTVEATKVDRRRCRRRSPRSAACAPTNRSRCVPKSPAASARSCSRKASASPRARRSCGSIRRSTQAEVQQARRTSTLAKSKYDRAVDLRKQQLHFGPGEGRSGEQPARSPRRRCSSPRRKLAKTEIKAPFSGIIGLRSVSVGDYVKEGADMVNLESIDPLKVDFRVPEIYMRQVQVGPDAAGHARRAARQDVRRQGVRGQSAGRRGRPRGRDPRAWCATTTRRCVPACSRACGSSRATTQDALVVPEQALVPQGDEQFVFRVVDGKAARVEGRHRPAPRRQGRGR